MDKQIVRKAVFPVAGLGTRFLPATKANPKEMLPVVDKPLIQYAVEEAISAGITQLIFVTSSSKRAIEDHFDGNHELESRLQERKKFNLLETVRSIRPAGINCVYVRQPEPQGLGNAVLCAREVVGDEPFAVLLADDLIATREASCLSQMMTQYKQKPSNLVAVEKIAPHLTEQYGIVDIQQESERVGLLHSIVEKPKLEQAPSLLAVAGRYILHPEIFDYLKSLQPGRGGEIQLTDAIAQLLIHQEVRSFVFSGKRFDCGSKLGYLTATIHYAMEHEEIGPEFGQYIASLESSSRKKVTSTVPENEPA